MTRMSRIVADRSSVAIGAGGILSLAAAVYRQGMARAGRHWHNRALPTVCPESIVSAFPPRSRSIAAGVALLCAAANTLAQTKPQVAPVRIVTDTYFGTTVADPYRYLEDVKDSEVEQWMKAQADFARNTLDRIPQRNLLLQ